MFSKTEVQYPFQPYISSLKPEMHGRLDYSAVTFTGANPLIYVNFNLSQPNNLMCTIFSCAIRTWSEKSRREIYPALEWVLKMDVIGEWTEIGPNRFDIKFKALSKNKLNTFVKLIIVIFDRP